jgi:hypothetical protein
MSNATRKKTTKNEDMVVVADEGVQKHHRISSSLRGKSTLKYSSLVVSRDFLFEDFRVRTKLMKNVSLSLRNTIERTSQSKLFSS